MSQMGGLRRMKWNFNEETKLVFFKVHRLRGGEQRLNCSDGLGSLV